MKKNHFFIPVIIAVSTLLISVCHQITKPKLISMSINKSQLNIKYDSMGDPTGGIFSGDGYQIVDIISYEAMNSDGRIAFAAVNFFIKNIGASGKDSIEITVNSVKAKKGFEFQSQKYYKITVIIPLLAWGYWHYESPHQFSIRLAAGDFNDSFSFNFPANSDIYYRLSFDVKQEEINFK